MSKIFDRNQKRKLLKDKETLIEMMFLQEQKINKLQKIADLASEWDHEIARVLGSHSALRLDISRIVRQDLPREMRVVEAVNLPAAVTFDPAVMDIQTSFYNLRKIFTEIRYNPESFRTMIRLIANNDKQSAMYVDESYMERCGFTERDIKWLAEDIARQLAYHMNKEYGW